jgi:hypothetical protein
MLHRQDRRKVPSQEVIGVQASVGGRLHVHAKTVGLKDRFGEIIQVWGANGTPPCVVRFPDGHESLPCPGPDCVMASCGQTGTGGI